MPLPLIFTGPRESAAYFDYIDEFVGNTLGPEARGKYSIVMDDPEEVGRLMLDGLRQVMEFRKQHGDAYYFNWRLTIEHDFQRPFTATHESMGAVELSEDMPVHLLAANLRRIFSGIVSGNVREDTMGAIEANGPFEIRGSDRLMKLLDDLLSQFVAQGRMKLASEAYAPCYRVVT
jgi:hypothetical protein